MPRIEKDHQAVTQITFIEVEPDKQQEALSLMTERARFMARQPGFISISLHRSLNRRRIVNYIQWQNRELLLAAHKSPDFRKSSSSSSILAMTAVACSRISSSECRSTLRCLAVRTTAWQADKAALSQVPRLCRRAAAAVAADAASKARGHHQRQYTVSAGAQPMSAPGAAAAMRTPSGPSMTAIAARPKPSRNAATRRARAAFTAPAPGAGPARGQ